MKKFLLTDEVLGYVTAENQTNTDQRNLVAGSRNVLIDRQRKVKTRNGFSRIGAADETIAPVRSAKTWNTSTNTELMLRSYDDELEVYLGTIDGIAVNAWTRVANGYSTSAILRFTTIYDDTEKLDLLLYVQGDDKMYEWSGAKTTIASTTSNTITKNGTETWAEARFYTAANKKVMINGTEYTYTGGETTTTLTGVTPDPTGEADDSVALQSVVINDNTPVDGRNNHYIGEYRNHVLVGSDDDELVYASKLDNHTNFSAASDPRLADEGFILTLDDTTRGFVTLQERLLVFGGNDSIYQVEFLELDVGGAVKETVKVKKYQTGLNQGAKSPETIVSVGNSIIYLSNEPAVRELVSPEQIAGGSDPRTLSNPIKPDMDAETWTNACATWYKNAYYLSAPTNGRVYILEFKEDADGKLRRFWQAPQTMFIRPFSPYNGKLYGHSASVPESYYLFDPVTFSDINSSDEKTAIKCVAKFAYRNYGDRANLKNFDEYFVEGEISPATTITTTINYDFGGATQSIEDSIDGSDFNILEETLEAVSLAQQPLGQQPLGGSVDSPDNTAKFRAILEIAKEDFFEMQAIYETDDIDKYWAILAHGPNAQLSTRHPNLNKI
jgi:hypothetical protein